MFKLKPELEEAILFMPQREKDKLLLRLIRKDRVLVDQLEFKLLATSEDQQEKYREIVKTIQQVADRVTVIYNTPGYILMDMRSISGTISYYLKITKDKIGFIALNLLMLKAILGQSEEVIKKFQSYRSYTLAQYAAKRLLLIIGKVEKLHPDYHIDFQADIQASLDFLNNNPILSQQAKSFDLPKNWGN